METASQSLPQAYFFDRRWPVPYVDNHLLALYKPSGLLVQGDPTGDACLLELGKQWIKARFGKPGRVFLAMVHRLDRPAAGVVLFARTSKAAGRLARQFRDRSVAKRYLVVVHGSVRVASGRLIDHIEHQRRVSRVVPLPTRTSQEARLTYRVLDKSVRASLLQVHLETGRRHQIRIQLARLGHPILGDLRYGADKPLPDKQIALLAQALSVDHPTLGRRLTVEVPVPQGWPWPGRAFSEKGGLPWSWRAFDSVFPAEG